MKQVVVNALLGARRVLCEMNAVDFALIAVLIAVGILAAATLSGPA